jgi:ATP-dependent DNA helicase PIF1
MGHTYFSFDQALDEDGEPEDEKSAPIDFAHSVTPQGLPPHELKLKKGAIVMLLRNMSTTEGLCNGTRLRVTQMTHNVFEAEILTGLFKGNTAIIPRICFISKSHLHFTLKRVQFPVRLAFAMTINKSQGQTFDRVGLYLPSPVFAHGQLYVAFSRVRNAESIKVKIDKSVIQGIETDSGVVTSNVVYPEIFMM